MPRTVQDRSNLFLVSEDSIAPSASQHPGDFHTKRINFALRYLSHCFEDRFVDTTIMMKFTSIASAVLVFTGFLPSQVAGINNITFLHINDRYSHFDELSFDIQDLDYIPCNLTVESSNIRIYYGGMPRVASVIKMEEAAANATGSPVVKIHADDAMTCTVFYTFFGPEMDAVAMDTIGLDAFVIGNREFDNGDSNLADFINLLDTLTLSYNCKLRSASPNERKTQ